VIVVVSRAMRTAHGKCLVSTWQELVVHERQELVGHEGGGMRYSESRTYDTYYSADMVTSVLETSLNM
jgi:hypothetical protein